MAAMLTRKIKRKAAKAAVREYIRHLSSERKWAWEYDSCANTVRAYQGRVVRGVDLWACGRAFAHYCRAVAVLSYKDGGIKAMGELFIGVRGLTPKSKTPTLDAIMAHIGFDPQSIARATPLTRELLERFDLTPGCVSIGRSGKLTVFERSVPGDSPWFTEPRPSWATVRTLPDGTIAVDIGPRPEGVPPMGTSPAKKAPPKPPRKGKRGSPPKPPPRAPKRRVSPPGRPSMGPPKPPSLGGAPKKKTTPPPPTKKRRRR